MKRNFDNAETLIRVENLCQYFKMGKRELKAVNNVSFDIKKGEVFGLVGNRAAVKQQQAEQSLSFITQQAVTFILGVNVLLQVSALTKKIFLKSVQSLKKQ